MRDTRTVTVAAAVIALLAAVVAVADDGWRLDMVLRVGRAAAVDAGVAAESLPDADVQTLAEFARAAAGDAYAQYRLGVLLVVYGQGDPRAEAEGARLIRLAAGQGLARAQHFLGLMYSEGRPPLERDIVEAVRWTKLAADQGLADAQHRLGRLYFLGEDVPKDVVEGARWIRLAAEQGQLDAQIFAGLMYAAGLGVPGDFAMAYAWLSVAAASGDAVAIRERDELGAVLSEEQTAEGQRLARVLWERIEADSGG